MTTNAGSQDLDGGEINFTKTVTAVWKAKGMLSGTCLAGLVLGLAIGLIVPKKYEASVVISPVGSLGPAGGASGALESAASSLGGIGSLLGVGSIGIDSRKMVALATLQSQQLTRDYIQSNNLLPILFAKKWDSRRRAWRDPTDPPTLWKGNRLFSEKVRSLSTDSKTGLSTLTITWTNPVLAADWANGLVALTNSYLREKAIEEAKNNIAYLTRQAAKTSVVGIQQAIYSVLQQEISQITFAEGTKEYALKVVDPAFAPQRPSTPKPWVWALLGGLAGVTVAVIIVVVRESDRA
jgi:LPS O-antigen subunit length determinant protein (WzzB/FepE family)